MLYLSTGSKWKYDVTEFPKIDLENLSISKQLDILYDWVDNKFLSGEFDVVNEFISRLRPHAMSVGLIVATLTITKTAYELGKLPAYKDFWHRFYTTSEHMVDWNSFLRGLEPVGYIQFIPELSW